MGDKSRFVQQWTFYKELHYALEREITHEATEFTLDSLIEETRKLEARLLRTPKGLQAVKDARKAADMPLTHEFEVEFVVQGYVNQTVQITDLTITAAQLQRGLKSGKYATTMQDGGQVIEVKTDKVIGQVVSVDNNCELADYQVEDESI